MSGLDVALEVAAFDPTAVQSPDVPKIDGRPYVQ
jgi:hypothetical protein